MYAPTLHVQIGYSWPVELFRRMSWCSIEPDWMFSLRCVATGISQTLMVLTLMVIEIWRQVWRKSGKAQDAFASWLIDRRGLREAEAFSWGAGAKTIRPSRAFLDLNRGTTNGACFSAFNVLSLVHDFSCLDVEWDTFWSGYNYSSEVCWVTPSLATVCVYLLKPGFDLVYSNAHFALVYLAGLGRRADWDLSSFCSSFSCQMEFTCCRGQR